MFDHRFAATFGCNTMLCALMWDALTVPDRAIPVHLLLGIDVPEGVQLGDGSIESGRGW